MPSTPSSPRARPRRRIALGALTLAVAAGIAIAVLGALAQRPHVHLRFLAGWMCLSIAGFLAVALVQAELWRALLRALGAKLEPRRGVAIWCASALARYVPTSMLMPVVRVSMSRTRGVPASICAASLVYEAVLVVCASLWVGSYYAIESFSALSGEAWRWGVLLAPLAFMLALSPRGMGYLSRGLLRRLGQQQLPVHLSLAQLALFAGGYVANFLLAGGSLLALVLACHALPVHAAPAVISAFAVGFAASAFSFLLPGGLGARELALVGALTPVMPVLVATAVAVASRLIQLALELLLAVLAPALAAWRESRATVAAGLLNSAEVELDA